MAVYVRVCSVEQKLQILKFSNAKKKRKEKIKNQIK